ncbi:cytoskeleton protein RodZ [Thiogranum longum]|uniref:Cytoskeleton protein RodZ n=1 Tax=Thiogranum longum TaxID=1537524 RepID=A0A4R1HDU2_9GAMM|nr:RodZ domain-containing protein [Thiogranum longum]TCK17479.1 cytoskeleton protein RodZ [Thiogranum longum]
MVDNDTEKSAESGLSAIGKCLSKGREEAGMEMGEVASELHLRVEVIQALEAGDEAALPAAAFIRGYVRSYARCVGLDEAALVARLPQATEHRPVPRQVARKHYRVPSIPLGRVLMWGLILLVLGMVLLYGAPALERLWSGQGGQPVDNSLQLPPSDTQVPDAGALPLPEEGSEEAPDVFLTEKPPEPERAQAPSVAVPDTTKEVVRTKAQGPAELVLRFTEDSWVEMTSRQRKLVVGTQHAGTERIVRAEPPIDILLGNAPGVKMTWRGKPVDLTPYQRGKVARIKLEN